MMCCLFECNTQKGCIIITVINVVFYCFFCDRTRLFVRWMHGTCIETPPQHAEGEDEPVVFSFFTDISSNPVIIDLVTTVSKSVQNSLGMLNKYLTRWRRYRPLWKLDKVGPCIVKTINCCALNKQFVHN